MLALVVAVILGVVLGLRSCRDDVPGDPAPVRGVPVAGLSGTPTATSPAPGDPSPGSSPSAASSVSPVAPGSGVLPTPASPPADAAERPWAGTWVIVDDPEAGIVIEGDDGGTYVAHAPDGSNEIRLLPVGDDRLVAAFTVTEDGRTRTLRIILTMDAGGDLISLEQIDAGETKTWELQRAE